MRSPFPRKGGPLGPEECLVPDGAGGTVTSLIEQHRLTLHGWMVEDWREEFLANLLAFRARRGVIWPRRLRK